MNTISSDKWWIVVNPAAGSGKAEREWSGIARALVEEDLSFSVSFTQKTGEATTLVRKAIEEGYRKIIAVGGDGTNHEAVNGILEQSVVDSKEILYALFPIGTGNDWARTYNIPRNHKAWLEMLKKQKTTLQDIGWLQYHREGVPKKRYFANVVGLAYDAFVVKEMMGMKSSILPGKILYLYMVLRCLFRYQLLKARVRYDDQNVTDFFYTINAGICSYSGGGMQLVPHAIPDDGKLALTLAGQLSKLSILLNSYRFYNASIGEHSKVKTSQTTTVRIEALGDAPLLVEADGEFLGETPVEIGLIEKALQVLIC